MKLQLGHTIDKQIEEQYVELFNIYQWFMNKVERHQFGLSGKFIFLICPVAGKYLSLSYCGFDFLPKVHNSNINVHYDSYIRVLFILFLPNEIIKFRILGFMALILTVRLCIRFPFVVPK